MRFFTRDRYSKIRDSYVNERMVASEVNPGDLLLSCDILSRGRNQYVRFADPGVYLERVDTCPEVVYFHYGDGMVEVPANSSALVSRLAKGS
jgi:hypothetical protein